MAKPPSASKQKAQQPSSVPVPAESVQLLRDTLGIDLESPQESLRARLVATTSRSVSPYTSAEMLNSYVQYGMPDVKDRALETIDEERRWRHAREEQEQNHQHAIDLRRVELESRKIGHDQALQKRSQIFSFCIGAGGTVGSLIAGFLHVPSLICIIVCAISVGGPSVASIVAQTIAKIKN
ncbi:hypothetical protein [Acetobacter orientalis]|uniref:hypothetical protein n=1 Tax=Acetobacter orientalis TaxID=146474 RepID=UPI0039E84A3F